MLVKGTYFLSPKQNNGDAYGAVTRGRWCAMGCFSLRHFGYWGTTHLDLLVWCLRKVPKIFSQMVVKNGDFHPMGSQSVNKSSTITNPGPPLISSCLNRTTWNLIFLNFFEFSYHFPFRESPLFEYFHHRNRWLFQRFLLSSRSHKSSHARKCCPLTVAPLGRKKKTSEPRMFLEASARNIIVRCVTTWMSRREEIIFNFSQRQRQKFPPI